MTHKVPPDAFDYYVSLGPGRSYQATAKRYGVSKTAIVKCAKRDQWVERLEAIQSEARDQSERKLSESFADMHERHLKMLRAMSARALTALRDYPIEGGMDAIRAADMVIKLERLIAGEASRRTTLTIEAVTREEIQALLTVVPSDADKPVEIGAQVVDDEDDEGEPDDAA